MIFLFTRDPETYDKLRVKDKKIYYDYLDEWDKSTLGFNMIVLCVIFAGIGYFFNFVEADLP